MNQHPIMIRKQNSLVPSESISVWKIPKQGSSSLPPDSVAEKRQTDPHRVIEGYIKEIKRLKRELGGAHALIKSYIETCRRNKINEVEALKRLCEGNPYTVQEILSKSPPK